MKSDPIKSNLFIPPPVIFFILVLIGALLQKTLPIARIIFPPLTYVGVLIIVAALGIGFSASRLFLINRTTLDPKGHTTKLVISGPFKFSRNPIYLSFVFILFGLAFFWGTLISFLMPLIMLFSLDNMVIPREEKSLENTFREEYINYKHKVRRWI